MAKICSKCGRKMSWSEYSYKGECEECYKGIPKIQQQTSYSNNISKSNNKNISKEAIIGFMAFFIIFILPIIIIIYSSQQSAEARKQTQLREFESQMRQDPTTWDKEQRDRYDSFIEWDMQNERNK